jgi:hypothetical protein
MKQKACGILAGQRRPVLTKQALAWGLSAFCLLLLLIPNSLSACAMSALIAREGSTLDDFGPRSPHTEYWRYNDPWDYFGFVMANSTGNSNNDGYGVVAYDDGSTQLTSGQAWYKRVKLSGDFGNTYYTGSYLDVDETFNRDGEDIMDTALAEIRDGKSKPVIVLCHARNATGHTYGNHPFLFDYANRTFSFMHHGYCNVARSFMINKVREMDPGGDWFEKHPSNVFHSTDPLHWVDSEVMFHYLMCHIIDCGGDVLAGLKAGLTGLASYLYHPQTGVFNFVMSDGSRLYVFRNTPLYGPNASYKLSYRESAEGYYAVRTLEPGAWDTVLQKCELVVLSRDEAPQHYPDFPAPEGSAGQGGTVARYRPADPVPGIVISPNPSYGVSVIKIFLEKAAEFVAEIFDIRGRLLWREDRASAPQGVNTVIWPGIDIYGNPVPNGVYMLRVRVGSLVYSLRISLIR